MAPKEPSLSDAMEGQWASMIGMATMFVTTIGLAALIQPFYDHDELRAFGPGSETKLGFVIVEGVFILVFTFVIIWLAKKNLQKFIQVGILLVLWIALTYSVVPMAHIMIPVDDPTMESTEAGSNATMIPGLSTSNELILTNGTAIMSVENVDGGMEALAGGTIRWVFDIENQTGEPPTSRDPTIVASHGSYVVCDDTSWKRFDSDTGNTLETYADDCTVGFVDTNGEAWHIVRQRILKIDPFKPIEEIDTPLDLNWMWVMPEGFDPNTILRIEHIGSSHLLIVCESWAGVIEIPSEPSESAFEPSEIPTTWNMTPPSGGIFSAIAYGNSPGEAINDTAKSQGLFLGHPDGSVDTLLVHSNGSVVDNPNINLNDAFEGPIRGLMLADCCNGGSNDLWVIDGNDLRIFMGSSMTDRSRGTTIEGDAHVTMALIHRDSPNHEVLMDGILLVDTELLNQTSPWVRADFVIPEGSPFEIGGVGVQYADIIGIVVAIVLMLALIIRPEWYVVNTAGILVGAGVSVMLGVSFVPWLVIIFMIGMAIYDHWAVNGSKHMLTLADTMIDLKLPILLVAPKDKDYSFLDEGDQVMTDRGSEAHVELSSESAEAIPTKPPLKPVRKKKSADAMFMGLGDVIFPGILVISSMTFLSGGAGFGIWSGPTMVAFGTLIGGLCGYMVLMTKVARGKPQAGLPLLNGGSILGYLISALLFIGPSALAFNITLF
ncbi:MAG: presenilin family intramembrane aspartyl protease PSH [Candidatus Thalassarchaeaceae archaeon]